MSLTTSCALRTVIFLGHIAAAECFTPRRYGFILHPNQRNPQRICYSLHSSVSRFGIYVCEVLTYLKFLRIGCEHCNRHFSSLSLIRYPVPMSTKSQCPSNFLATFEVHDYHVHTVFAALLLFLPHWYKYTPLYPIISPLSVPVFLGAFSVLSSTYMENCSLLLKNPNKPRELECRYKEEFFVKIHFSREGYP